MRILLTIHHHLEPDSGAPGSTLALADAYARAGHETSVLSFDELSPLPFKMAMIAFPFYAAGALARRSRTIDVVDASTGDAWLWSFLRRPGGPLLVARSHGLEHYAHTQRLAEYEAGRMPLRRRYFVYHGGERLWEVATSLRRSDLVFFLNQIDRRFAIEELGISPDLAHVSPNGLDAALLGLPFPDGAADVGIAVIGRHTREKGAPAAVAALESILLTHERARALLLGSAVDEARVLADFDPAVRSRVRVVPHFHRADLPSLLAGAEILLSATLIEGFGKAMLEAMACGLVPVAVRAPGTLELVQSGENGLLVPREPAALAAGVERLLADQELRLRLRRNAQATAQRFSWDAIAAERLGLIEQALEAR